MKRLLILLTALAVCGGSAVAEQAPPPEKYAAMPPIFAVTVESVERQVDEGAAYVYKEYLHTANEAVNAELRALTDAYDAQMSPLLQPDPKKRGKTNSRLDVATVYYRTGERWISTMVLANVQFMRAQLYQQMTTRTYDLQTGQRVTLADLFAPDSPAWGVLSRGVSEQLQHVFPGEPRDMGAIPGLCAKPALEQADFTLSGMELTLHYPASVIFRGKTQLIHVRFFYPQFRGMMTPLGAAATDNRRWKMVAITCDDGPKDVHSTYALTAFRKAGARVTYFLVGKQLERYGDVLIREFDQNQIFGNHSYNHWSGYTFKTAARRRKELAMSDALTLSLVGEAAAFFRAPGGTYPPWEESDLPVPIIQWSLDTFDYTGKSAKKIFYSIRNNVQENDIILCHDTGKYLNAAVPLFGEYLTGHGYMMVTLQELMAAQGVTAAPSVVYWSFRPGENSVDLAGTQY